LNSAEHAHRRDKALSHTTPTKPEHCVIAEQRRDSLVAIKTLIL